jgi:hypothetical protein
MRACIWRNLGPGCVWVCSFWIHGWIALPSTPCNDRGSLEGSDQYILSSVSLLRTLMPKLGKTSCWRSPSGVHFPDHIHCLICYNLTSLENFSSILFPTLTIGCSKQSMHSLRSVCCASMVTRFPTADIWHDMVPDFLALQLRVFCI